MAALERIEQSRHGAPSGDLGRGEGNTVELCGGFSARLLGFLLETMGRVHGLEAGVRRKADVADNEGEKLALGRSENARLAESLETGGRAIDTTHAQWMLATRRAGAPRVRVSATARTTMPATRVGEGAR